MSLVALDLCAGAGGFSLGLQRAGFDVLGVEIDVDAADTHRRHVGPCEIGDIRTWKPSNRFDVVAGGPPCQPFSDAGKGLALADPRYLIPDFLRIAREAQARAVIIENVRGLVKKTRAFRAVLDAVEAEYHTTWIVLDAADQGVPQNRDRVFIVGFRYIEDRLRFKWPGLTHWPAYKNDGPRVAGPDGKKSRRGAGTLSLFGDTYVTVREALSLGNGQFRHGLKEGAKPQSPQGMRLLDVDSPAPAVSGSSADLLDLPSPCITATEHKSAMNGTQPMGRRRRASERLSDALPNHTRLSPEQCAALQDFPPDWTFTGTKKSQYKQIGNAVPPKLAYGVGMSVRAAIDPSAESRP